MLAIIPISATLQSSDSYMTDDPGGFEETSSSVSPGFEPSFSPSSSFSDYHSLKEIVTSGTACDLPGVSIKFAPFMACMWKSVAKGFVKHEHATFVAEGLRDGFRCGVDTKLMRGHRWFRNYPSATSDEAHGPVSTAIAKRVSAVKTLSLGLWEPGLAGTIRATFTDSAIFPMGAVEKNPLYEPGAMRPTSDHSRTGLNAATDLSLLSFALKAYQEAAAFFVQDYFTGCFAHKSPSFVCTFLTGKRPS